MLAARMHEYRKPLVLEQVQEAKNLSGENVLVKVGGAGICRTDLQLIDGYFREYLDLELPATLGHEIAGWVEEVGDSVPENFVKRGWRKRQAPHIAPYQGNLSQTFIGKERGSIQTNHRLKAIPVPIAEFAIAATHF